MELHLLVGDLPHVLSLQRHRSDWVRLLEGHLSKVVLKPIIKLIVLQLRNLLVPQLFQLLLGQLLLPLLIFWWDLELKTLNA
jgi:ABC-type uncharacterized transport system permease subunit